MKIVKKVHQENCQKRHQKKSKEKVPKNHLKYYPKTCLKSEEFKNSMALLEFSICKSDFGNHKGTTNLTLIAMSSENKKNVHL